MTLDRFPQGLPVLVCLLLAACAEVPPLPPKIERITAEQVEALLPQPLGTVTLDDVVAMSRAGTPPEQIIKRLDEAKARYRLSATQLAELQRRGVDLLVLDHMVASERHAIFEDVAADITRREMACLERVAAERRLWELQATPLFWPHPFFNCWPVPPPPPRR